MFSRKLVILGVVMSLAGLGSGADGTFDSNPMGVNVTQTGFYMYEGGLQEWISGTESTHWLVNFSDPSPWLYSIYVGDVLMEEDTYVRVETNGSGEGSFMLSVYSATESVSNAFIAFLAYDENNNGAYDGDDTAEHLVVGYLY